MFFYNGFLTSTRFLFMRLLFEYSWYNCLLLTDYFITQRSRESEAWSEEVRNWTLEFFFFFLHHFALCGSSRMYIASKPVLNCRSFSFQIGSGARLHSVSAERAWRLVDPSGGVCEGTEWDYLFAARRWRTGEDVRQKSVWTCAETD